MLVHIQHRSYFHIEVIIPKYVCLYILFYNNIDRLINIIFLGDEGTCILDAYNILDPKARQHSILKRCNSLISIITYQRCVSHAFYTHISCICSLNQTLHNLAITLIWFTRKLKGGNTFGGCNSINPLCRQFYHTCSITFYKRNMPFNYSFTALISNIS